MGFLLLLVAIALTVLYIQRWRERVKRQQRVGVQTFLERWKEHHIYQRMQDKTAYTDSSLHRLTLLSLVCMLPGGLIGMYFQQMELGLLLSILLAALPTVRMLLLKRKKQQIILKQAIPMLTALEWAYKSHAYSVEKALLQAKDTVPEVISEDYNYMLQKVHAGMKPSEAMQQLGEQTKSAVFFNLGGIFAVQEKRNSPEAFRSALKLLISHVVKTNNRLSAIEASLNEKKVFLFMLLLITVMIMGMTFNMMQDPMGYFRSPAGSRMLLLGVTAMVIPFILYFMSSLRRRF